MRVTLILIALAPLLPICVHGQQTHAALSEQKMCATQAKKFFNETAYSDNSRHPLKNEFTSHYDAANKVCYVRIDYTKFDTRSKSNSVGIYVFDAFEGRNLASYIQILDREWKNIGKEPTECWVKPINGSRTNCSTEEEFESLVDRLFGLGEE